MSTVLNDFHFLRPLWLLGVLPLVALLWHLSRRRSGEAVLRQFCDPALLPYISSSAGVGPRRLGLLCGLAGLLGLLALAGPTCQRLPQPLFRDESALVIALDLSRSMEAADITPSRLVRARFKIRDLLATRDRGQTALIVFAGRPFVVTPLTNDLNTITSQLEIMTPELMPTPGSDLLGTLTQAAALLEQAGHRGGDILLVTDGVPGEQRAAIESKLKATPWRVSVLALGTRDGAPIPAADGGFIKEAGGALVLSRLDPGPLQALATAGRGQMVVASTDDSDITRLKAMLDSQPADTTAAASERMTEQWAELGPWLVVLLLPLGALAFRRGVVWSVVLLLGALRPGPAAAIDWWFTPDQAAQRAFTQKDYAGAAQRFEHPGWRAAAQYRQGDFAGAGRTLAETPEAEERYNLGNALARQGQLEKALAAYDAVLKQDPKHDDARYNKSLIEDALRQQQDKQDKQDPQDDKKKQPKDEQQQGEPGKGEGEGQQQDAAKPEDGAAGSPSDQAQEEQAAQEARDQQADETSRQSDQEGKGKGNAAMDDSQRKAAAEQAAKDAAGGQDEEKLSAEQWLRQVPDDPGGLWRRKFQYQYQRQYGGQAGSKEPW